MATVHEDSSVDVGFWGPGARFFATDNGDYLVVVVDPTPDQPEESRIVYIPSPTMVFHTDDQGHVTDMALKQDYPPRTTHEQALELAGFTLVTE